MQNFQSKIHVVNSIYSKVKSPLTRIPTHSSDNKGINTKIIVASKKKTALRLMCEK